MVTYAGVIAETYRHFGRLGLGAVFGSKQLKALVVASVVGSTLGLTSAGAVGVWHWYTIVAACVSMPIAVLHWVTASVPRPSPTLIRLAIVAAVIRCAIGAGLSLQRGNTLTWSIVFGLVLPVLIARYIITNILAIARETAEPGLLNPAA